MRYIRGVVCHLSGSVTKTASPPASSAQSGDVSEGPRQIDRYREYASLLW